MMFTALLLAQAVAAPAAAPAPVCPAAPPALPADLGGWRSTGADLASGKAVSVPTMDPATLRLAGVPLPKQPGRMAIQTVRITTAGTYGIALDQKGWIDLYRLGTMTALPSARHGHGPDCSGIRKIVRYDLTPGQYRVVVGGMAALTARMMLVR
ncbi:hypothetical protein ASE86_06690 [Sphingomonas sp. Leaf33]|uniref:hypothetical protein n=1 Tax=Sphingomonas sp. Leaf33 TaxID=1736215 RepID=UPI0006F69702|nr:hypothetical protein [Sphingomonas sp. Leaf33]KQN25875.1 hypothetical protein ASE86_06690 [Sphingomonas sp. Leaf33]